MRSTTFRVVVLIGVLSLVAAASAWAQCGGCPYAKGEVVPYVYTGGWDCGGGWGWGCGGGCGGGCGMAGYPGGKWKWDEACGAFVQTGACAPCGSPCGHPCAALRGGPCGSPCGMARMTTRKYSWADAPKGPCGMMARPCWSPCWSPCGGPVYAWAPGGAIEITKVKK